MTPEEQRLAFAINSKATDQPSVTPDEFLSLTGIHAPQDWALDQLEEAIRSKNPDDAEAALVVAAVFGMDSRWSGPLASLLSADWHELHEDVAFDLGWVGDAGSVPALVRAVHWHPDHLDYDEGRALAMKAIHSLGKIRGSEAENALRSLLNDDNPEVRATTERVLSRRVAN